MKQYIRLCPSCNKQLEYSSYHSFWIANKNKSSCRTCSSIEINNRPHIKEAFMQRFSNNKGDKNGFWNHKHSEATKNKLSVAQTGKKATKQTRQKLSIATSGKNNPMFNRSVYNVWVQKYGIDEADKRYQQYVKKQSINSSGKNNPMFGKPSPQGSGNGWSGWYKGWFFRSLKELSYMINVIEKENLVWETAETKKYAIPYIDYNGQQRTYYADFVVNNKTIIEVKPKKFIFSKAIQAKVQAAKIFAKTIGLEYDILEPSQIPDEQIVELYKSKMLVFTKRYEKKYMKRFGVVS